MKGKAESKTLTTPVTPMDIIDTFSFYSPSLPSSTLPFLIRTKS